MSPKLYQCKKCGYIYNESDGDPYANIPSGTTWENLPKNWKCPICGNPKEEFEELEF